MENILMLIATIIGGYGLVGLIALILAAGLVLVRTLDVMREADEVDRRLAAVEDSMRGARRSSGRTGAGR